MSGFYAYLEGIIILGVAGYFYWRQRQQARYQHQLDQAAGIDDPLLIPLYAQNATLTVMSTGMLGAYPYRMSYAKPAPILLEPFSPRSLLESNQDILDAAFVAYHNNHLVDRIILTVDLPTRSPHIISMTHHHKDLENRAKQLVATEGLIRVTLEGDFSQYFDVYTNPGKERELLQVLDPTAMVLLIDYCKEYDWELIGNQLTVIQSDKAKSNVDETGLVQDSTAFATKILPTLLRMSND